MQEASESRGSYARSEGTRKRILDAAMELASSDGFQGVSVARIADRAGVAVGILNYHFGSKSQLLTELMTVLMQDFISQVTPRSEGADFFAYEQSLLRIYLRFLHANPTYVRLTEEVRHYAPELFKQGTKAFVGEISKRLKSGIELGELKHMNDAEILAQAYLIQGAYAFLDRFLEDDQYPGDDVLLATIDSMFRRGIGRN